MKRASIEPRNISFAGLPQGSSVARQFARVWLLLVWQKGIRAASAVALCLLALMAATGAAHAASVSGTISSSTTWTTAQSPYVLQGDVVLDNNATLVIQPGVQVRMAAGASFTLRQGALQAVGTSSSPIVITSDAAAPQPGDWGQWRLTSGTRSAQTLFDHVRMSYGSGLVIEGCAPVLNNVAIQNHSGPAISVDLAASPAGRNLSASGNTLNAIAVPSGTIRGQVVWGLVGIPYLVQQGIVQVGQSPLSLEPGRLRLSPGVVAILRLALSAPAPAGGLAVDLTSSVPSVASVVSRATVAAGQYGADVEVQAKAVGTTSITASHATLGSAAALIEVVNLPALELLPSAPTIGVQRPYAMTLRAPAAAPAGGLNVTLGNSDGAVLSAPSSLRIPAGQQSVSFDVTGLADGASRLSAQAEGFGTGLATVTVRGKALVLPTSVVVAPGAQTLTTVQLTEPAPAGGLAVSLSTGATATATVPATVSVAAGASQASFNVSGVALGTTTLTASAAGYQGTQTAVRVDAIALDLEPTGNLTLNVDQSLTRRVQLSKPAPAGGVTIQVGVEDAATASVSPAEVFVPEGQVIALTPLTVRGLAIGQTKLNLTAAGLISKAVNVDVKDKFALKLYQINGQAKVIAGKGLKTYEAELQIQRLINGAVAGGAEPLTVSLRCAAESVCAVPATVTIPAGQSYANVPVTGVDLGTTQIEATADGATAATPMPMEVVAPVINFESIDGTRTTAGVRDNVYLTLSTPGTYYPHLAAAVQALTVNLSLVDQSPAGVVNGIYNAATGGTLVTQMVVPAGSRAAGWVYIAQPTQAGTYRVRAEIAGITTTLSAVQTVTAANQALKFYQINGQAKVIAGKGLKTYEAELQIQRLINGAVAGGAEPLTVSLRCAAESVCAVPATVTIPAGQSYANVPVTGVDLGTTQIEATADGATAATPMPMEVVAPVINFESIDGTRTTAGVRDNVYLTLSTPGTYYPHLAAAVQALTVNLSLVDQSPAGVVNGIYNAATGGTLVTQMVVPAGSRAAGWVYIAQPTQAGTYRVRAEIAGITTTLSAVQTVTAANQALKFYQINGQAKVIAGKGLKTYEAELQIQRLINGAVAGGAEPLTVSLRCAAESVCAVPATVTIPAGQSYANVPVTGVDLGTTQIEATADGATAATPMPMEVVAPVINFESIDGTRTTAGVRDNVYLTLSTPGTYYPHLAAAVQALTVNLSLVDQSPAGVVNGIYNAATGGTLVTQMVVPAGSRAAGWVYIAQPTQAGTYRVRAEIAGITTTLSAVQTVTAANQGLRLYQVNARPKVVVGKGLKSYIAELRVQRLDGGVVVNGAEAVTVSVRCVAASVCSVPTTVTIPAGQSYADVQVAGVDLGSTQIEATASSFDAGSINVETVTPQLVFYSGLPSSLQVGQNYTSVRVYADVPGAYYSGSYLSPAQALAVTFTSSVPSAATVGASGTWPAGTWLSNGVTLTGVAAGTTTLTASVPGFAPVTSAPITINP
ncbi:MAG: hypothetical protein QM772_14440 [Ottowia sp.]|uniref:hypothetical protein n=1 Tax=Ottowia sp. TaxID=1898956 RepID=UPI0039E239AC